MTRVERVLDPAYRLATVLMSDPEAAEKVVHAVALSAWPEYRRRGAEVISFRTWFLARVVRRCQWARLGRRLTLRHDTGMPSVAGLGDALMKEPPTARAALFCYYFLDLPPDEAARVLGMSLGRLRSVVNRAGARLQAGMAVEHPRAEPPDNPGPKGSNNPGNPTEPEVSKEAEATGETKE